MDDVDRRHPCALAPTTARCTSALGAKLARARFLANSVKWQYFLHGRWVLSAGAPEEIRTPDPQIRSLVGTTEIIEVRSKRIASVAEVAELSSSRRADCYRKAELYPELFIPQ